MTTRLTHILTTLEALRAEIRALALESLNKRDYDSHEELATAAEKLEKVSEHITDYVLPYLK